MDWLQAQNPASRQCWIAGFSFGAWIGMQLMMRRPEIHGFISVTPPATTHDFSFLAPCPASGLIINGEYDEQVPPDAIYKLVDRLSIQKGVNIDIDIVPGANHFFTDHLEPMIGQVAGYLDAALADGTLTEPDFDPLA
jgi:alpha/beta superfamily hydrolase